jgi:putative heme-binding domain-containing protein
LGTHPLAEVRGKLTTALGDSSPVVARRACESLVRAGLSPETKGKEGAALFALLDSQDQFLRSAARLAIMRSAPDGWVPQVLKDDLGKRPRGALEGMLALVESPNFSAHRPEAFTRIVEYAQAASDPDQLLNAVRLAQIAQMRAGGMDGVPAEAAQGLREAFLAKFPHSDWRVNRELQVSLCGLQTPAAIEPILGYLEKTENPEEQIHTVYCLRAEKEGWTPEQRARLVKWFDKGWEIEGGVSLDGYVNDLWEATLALLTDEEKSGATKHREEFMAARQARAAELMAALESEKKGQTSDLAQRNFTEIAEYLEYDPMAYKEPNLKAGEKVFMRSRCSECHIFGSIGKGGGPDLSTASSRFSRRDMLEAIMYPSKVVSDQYRATDIEMKDGNFYTGLIMGENGRSVTVLTLKGERMELKKKDIAKETPSTQSVMPEGLLETMNFGDLVNLIQFLEEGNKGTE